MLFILLYILLLYNTIIYMNIIIENSLQQEKKMLQLYRYKYIIHF